MGRRMEHDGRAILLEDIAQPIDIAHAPDFDNDFDIVVFSRELALQQVRIVFVHIEDDNSSRRYGTHLAAKL